MKKSLTFIATLCLALSFTLTSCGKKIDSSVWLSNLEDAKKVAKKENKKIFLFFSDDEADKKSSNLKEHLFNTDDFIKTYTEKYVLVNLDYSNSRYENDQENLKRDMRIYEVYNAALTPYFLLLSAEGFAISKVAFEDSADLDTARITFSELESETSHFDELLAKTKTGSTEERLAAINEIFDSADPGTAYHLRPLNELYISLDKKNESGQYLKHLIALTYAKAEDFFLNEEPEKGCEEFAKLADNKIISLDDKQMALYTAGYILAQSGSQNLEKIRDYFKQAYDIAPESNDAQNIKMSLDYVQMLIDGEGDDAPNYNVPQKEEAVEPAQQ